MCTVFNTVLFQRSAGNGHKSAIYIREQTVGTTRNELSLHGVASHNVA
jgi:hypothetical protein